MPDPLRVESLPERAALRRALRAYWHVQLALDTEEGYDEADLTLRLLRRLGGHADPAEDRDLPEGL